MVERGEKLYARWGPLAVFFTPAIVSGTAKMRPYQFAFWNLLDSLAWTLLVAASAYGVGRVCHGPPHRARYRHLGHRAWRRGACHLRRRAPSPKAHGPAFLVPPSARRQMPPCDQVITKRR